MQILIYLLLGIIVTPAVVIVGMFLFLISILLWFAIVHGSVDVESVGLRNKLPLYKGKK